MEIESAIICDDTAVLQRILTQVNYTESKSSLAFTMHAWVSSESLAICIVLELRLQTCMLHVLFPNFEAFLK